MRQVPIIIQKQTKLYLVLNYCKHNLKEVFLHLSAFTLWTNK